jgi:hypothetical protein
MKPLKRSFVCGALVGVFAVAACAMISFPARAQSLSATEAAAIASDAYVYLYPLVSMDVTRKQSTNIEGAGQKPGFAPMNAFSNWPPEFRYPVFHRLSRSHQRAGRRVCPGYGRTVLSFADAGHVD